MNRNFNNKFESTQNCLLSSSSTKFGLESFPVHTPLLSLYLFFPSKLGNFNVHLKMACGDNGNPVLVDGNQEKTRVVSPNFDTMQGIPKSIIQHQESSVVTK